jgi:hypothetical protein
MMKVFGLQHLLPAILALIKRLKGQRKYPRYPVNLSATFFSDRKSGFVKIGNISTGGCGIESDVLIMRGDVGQLLIDVPGGNASLKVSKASVRWVRGKQCGLEFILLNQHDREGLHRFTSQLAVGVH